MTRRAPSLPLLPSEAKPNGCGSLLSPRDVALVDAVAVRVLELLDERAAPRLVDAATLADLLGVSRSTVYEHAIELGARSIGSGARPRLRFDVETALGAWSRRSGSVDSQAAELPARTSDRRRRRPSRLGSGTALLPVFGDEGA